MYTGLVSVTFRELPPLEVIRLVKEAGQDGIEWGGDVHCPPGHLEKAGEIKNLMDEYGLTAFSYGSYYYSTDHDFNPVLESALALGAPNIRIWAGKGGSGETDEPSRRNIVKNIQNAADKAAEQGISLSFEYHGHTLTDTIASTAELLDSVNRPNVFTYWQAPAGMAPEENTANIKKLAERNKLKNIHVQHHKNARRFPLEDGKAEWAGYIKAAAASKPVFLIEFVKDDDPKQFLEDARFLNEWVRGAR